MLLVAMNLVPAPMEIAEPEVVTELTYELWLSMDDNGNDLKRGSPCRYMKDKAERVTRIVPINKNTKLLQNLATRS